MRLTISSAVIPCTMLAIRRIFSPMEYRLVGHNDDAGVINALTHMVAMQQGEVADFKL